MIGAELVWDAPWMGGHLAHLLHVLSEEVEHGGPVAVIGMIAGAVAGNSLQPVMHPAVLCESSGLGKDALGQCPSMFDFDGLLVVLLCAALGAAVAIAIVWVVSQGKDSAA
ncbi:MAG: hypothetical protein JWR63_1212 [Conexibacter sp.]|nr:hypothetical protein [Conexibacter sp.]